MNSSLRLTAVTAMIAAAGVVAVVSPASAGAAATCPSHDTLVAQLRADGFTAQAANTFATLVRRDCA
jgi:hypothetical protein